MALPYSTRFIGATLTAPASSLYTVPAGQRAVIRTVTFSTGGTGGVSGNIQIVGLVTLIVVASMGANLTQIWDLHTVVNTGEQIYAQASVGGLYVSVSGYLLSTAVP